jgi:hypothetical protein
MKRSHLMVGFYLLAVFASGAIVGAFAHRLYAVRSVMTAPPPRLSPEEWRRNYVSEVRTRLSLDDNQVAQLNIVLDRTRGKFREIREKYRPEMRQIQEEQVREIRALLNPSQQSEYEKFQLERDKRRKEMEGRH